MNELVSTLNGLVWSPALIYLCLGVGLYFSLRGRFLQVRHFNEMIRLMFTGKTDEHGITSFQALTMTLAGRVGTGNIAGVATAITFGGPGAVFWMWMVAFLGASSAFVESTLGQVYKEKLNGEYRGGPAFYIEKGLGLKWYAWLFAVVTVFACGLLLPGVQANSIASSVNTAFGIDPNVTAAVLAVLIGLIIFGGVKRIAHFTQVVVPFMALGYILVALVIILLNIGKLPEVVMLIVKSAFGLEAGSSLALLCSPGSSFNGAVSSLARNCQLASVGDGTPGSRRASATATMSRPGGGVGLSFGEGRDTLPAWLSPSRVASAGEMDVHDLTVFAKKDVGDDAYVSLAGTLAKATLIPSAAAPANLSDHWTSRSLSVGGGIGRFSANIVGQVVDTPGLPKWEGVGLGVSWRTPWSGQLTVGADNVITRGKNPFSKMTENADDEGAVPYIRYQQDL